MASFFSSSFAASFAAAAASFAAAFLSLAASFSSGSQQNGGYQQRLALREMVGSTIVTCITTSVEIKNPNPTPKKLLQKTIHFSGVP